ncbi:hypothetical protein [Pallidibacillus pasinlerensis]|uniref:LPXTG cell wall anchor domain-containing protein n=1 Tax=Pallidibacillus pasinlerensis TaxID=2703818 RepID=A0ABX0A507_9BACI|nr:hypothetical protein [Pallidibacillus pasinlerensis]NCU18461.1 hypothetical protein [Pallidibacillus pasinlerensis]
MRKLFTLILCLTLLMLVCPVLVAFAQTNGLDNSFNNNLQDEVTIIASNDIETNDHEETTVSHDSHDSHSAHGEYHGHGGESKNAIYISVLSVLGIFVLIGLAYLALRKSMKES